MSPQAGYYRGNSCPPIGSSQCDLRCLGLRINITVVEEVGISTHEPLKILTKMPSQQNSEAILGRIHIVLMNADRAAAAALRNSLVVAGHVVTIVNTTAEAIKIVAEAQRTIVVLDVLHEGADALVALNGVPSLKGILTLLLISPSDTKDARYRAFEFRADAMVLLSPGHGALVDAIRGLSAKLSEGREAIRCGDLTLRLAENRLITTSCETAMKPALAELLCALMTRHPHTLSYADILNEVVHFSSDARTNAVYNRVYELRRELKRARAEARIESVARRGYRLVIGVDAGVSSIR
jgi:two-component system, OmpR family, response regulator